MDLPPPADHRDEILDYIGMRRKAGEMDGYVLKISDKTPSMLGSGYAGKHVIVVTPPEYAPGDDIVFASGLKPGHQTLHRVTHVKPGYVYTKGTFNSTGDGWIPLKDVKGKVAWPRPKM